MVGMGGYYLLHILARGYACAPCSVNKNSHSFIHLCELRRRDLRVARPGSAVADAVFDALTTLLLHRAIRKLR